MVSRCANALCGVPFKYLHEGRLFQFETSTNLMNNSSRFVFWWLCPRCCLTMTLVQSGASGMTVVGLDSSGDRPSGRDGPKGLAYA